jgi:uncharacterized protein with NRDE domain
MAPWDDVPGMIAGRDLQAAGAWFAVDAKLRVGIVTNFREFGRRRRSAPSRGGLIPGYLAGNAGPGEYLRQIETDAPGYAGFNLLLADRDSLWYASNRADQFARELPPGIYGLSTEFLDTPWPKVVRTRTRFVSPPRRKSCLPGTCPPNGHASCRPRSCSIRRSAHVARPS